MIVFPMAGRSRRFLQAGYKKPKYMLEAYGRPLFDWVVKSFENYFSTELFVFIHLDSPGVKNFLEQRINELGIINYETVALNAVTKGQAETVEFGVDHLNKTYDGQISIFNIDTIRPKFNLSFPKNLDGMIEVFEAEGDHWSFVKPSTVNRQLAARTTEKERISNLCCTGFYHFSSYSFFKDALEAERTAPSSGELYIAPLYNHLIKNNKKIGWYKVPNSSVLLSGIPSEYEELVKSQFTKYL